jgi:hypothetical protein
VLRGLTKCTFGERIERSRARINQKLKNYIHVNKIGNENVFPVKAGALPEHVENRSASRGTRMRIALQMLRVRPLIPMKPREWKYYKF